MRKQWFDKRADEGQYFTVSLKIQSDFDLLTWKQQVRVWYEPTKFINARPTDANKYGRMSREEAIVMAKLLNTTIETGE